MNFTSEHTVILDKHLELWNIFRASGVVRNLDRPIIDSFQKVYNEVIGPEKFTHWCNACVTDMFQRLFFQYDKWKEDNPITEEAEAVEKKSNRRERRQAENNVRQTPAE